jgi:caffeoyl-CoA O-methyltransferase
MMKSKRNLFRAVTVLCILIFFCARLYPQLLNENPDLDKRVKKFLSDHSGKWYDLNVPAADGQMLYNIIIENNYRSALEIGTSTGHSGIWIAWALSKTGGKLITIDINERRRKEALENFREAGVADIIDSRLADAHQLVKELNGPFDFVFSDADKGWYKNYFIAVDPKLVTGGCFVSHNVYNESYRNGRGQQEYLEYVRSLGNYETTVYPDGGGLAISYKRAGK